MKALRGSGRTHPTGEVRYARRLDGDIAYQVVEAGPIDLVVYTGASQHPIDLLGSEDM